MAIKKTSKAQFERFQNTFMGWAEILGLRDRNISFEMEKLPEAVAALRETLKGEKAWKSLCSHSEEKVDERATARHESPSRACDGD